MLFNSVFYVTFLAILAPNSEMKEQIYTETGKSEAIFADVIKNISRVNNVLQELISNYEHLQKIYKSQENFESTEYSSESEVDRFYKNNKKAIKNNKNSRFFQKESTDKSSTTLKHVTQMILSDIEGDKRAKTGKPIETKSKPPNIENLQISEKKPNAQKTTPETKIALYFGETSSSEETVETSTKPTKGLRATRVTKTVTTTTEKLIEPIKPVELIEPIGLKEQIKPEIIFIDTHKIMENKTDKKKPRIMPEIALEEAPKKLKTRYSVKDMPGINKDHESIKTNYLRVRNSSNPTLNRLQMVKDEPSSKEVATIKSKVPAKKKGTDETTAETKDLLSPKSEINATKIIFNANDKLNEESSSEMTDNDNALTKDLFKTSVLRQAYGNACLKLIVRKCYKACKETLKRSCRAVKCKDRLKFCYKKHYKASCNKAFEDTPGLTFRRYLKTEGIHVDMTRAGYLSVACQPRVETGMPIMLHNETPNQTADQNNDKELNMLRDRYEKACTRISQDKCQSACNYAQNATCVKFECEKRLKKNLRRNCKSQCKRAYTLSSSKKGSGSGSGSDSGSESETETETDTDSESESDSDTS